MANAKQVSAAYFEFIGRKVVEKFGGSYQNYQTMGKVWRQQIPYKPVIEEFIFAQTRLFLRLLNVRDQSDFNFLYKLCAGMAEHISKYLVKKAPGLTRKDIEQEVMDNILFKSDKFIANFKRRYKHPIDESNKAFVTANPGITAMYDSLKANGR